MNSGFKPGSGAVRSLVFISLVFIAWVCVTLTSPQFSIAGTVLGDLAASMQPGTWAELTTNNIAVFKDCGQGHHIPYAEGIRWDPVTRAAYYFGSDDPISCPAPDNYSKFIRYVEATNTWELLPTSPYAETGHVHQYDGVDIDVVHRTFNFLHAAGSLPLRVYNLDTGTWTSRGNAIGGYVCCEGMAYFPEAHAFFHVRQGDLYRLDDGASTWVHVSGGMDTNYHSFIEYNPIHKVMLFGGGNGKRTVYKLTSDGVIKRMSDSPVGMRVPSAEFTYDPVTGIFILFEEDAGWYTYDVTRDTWTPQSRTGVPAQMWVSGDGDPFNSLATPIPNHGVIMFTSCTQSASCKVFLYKHAPQTADVTPPAKPSNLRVQ